MADASSDWADRPAPDQALSSDEEDFVSSQSTASADPNSLTQKHLGPAFTKLHLDTPQLQHSSQDNASRTSASAACASILDGPISKSEKLKMELLDLPLDVLKLIVKEVCQTSSSTLSRRLWFIYSLYAFVIGYAYERPHFARANMLCAA